MQMTLGFSPCPNDTFMMYALLHGATDPGDHTWLVKIEDVESLNNWALQGKLDVTKLSFSTWLRVKEDYTLLDAGAALGFGCGPLIIAKKMLPEEEIIKGPVAIPGELTTANFLFSMRYPEATNKIPMLFSDIESAVQSGQVVAGVIIHENRFTYANKGLVRILDLGEFWEQKTGCAIPLGAFAAKTSLGEETIGYIEKRIRQSVQYALQNPEATMKYVRSLAQEMDEAVIQAHINTYVNEFSVSLGEAGKKAVNELERQAGGFGS
jgi:1,4-dihydroxy-6-naphthoate synthase